MTQLIHFNRPDGKDCPAYLATPAAGDKAPAVVVIQEYWGLNEQIKKTADRFAAAGFRALVPDLYRGKLATSADEAGHMMSGLNFGDAAGQDIRGAVQYLKKTSSKVAVGGFCMGGALTILAALHVPEMDAGVCFYGMPPAAFADPSKITIPMNYHFANIDDWCTPDLVNKLESAVSGSKSEHALYRYDAHHAFMNDSRADVYDAGCATLGWGRTLAFLSKVCSA
jgi:carboxymethylenebutenolidase